MKNMLEAFKKDHQVIIYCDLHGHSRKPNVFMYGCTADPNMASMSNFIEERLFPWMMSQKVIVTAQFLISLVLRCKAYKLACKSCVRHILIQPVAIVMPALLISIFSLTNYSASIHLDFKA